MASVRTPPPAAASVGTTASAAASDGGPFLAAASVGMSSPAAALVEAAPPAAASDGTPPPAAVDDGPSTSFNPSLIRPHPKAPERKLGKGVRKRRHSAILTDTPEKEQLENERNKRITSLSKTGKGIKKNLGESIGKSHGKKSGKKKTVDRPNKKKVKPKQKTRVSYESSSSSEEEAFCLVCDEPFTAIHKKREQWIQCVMCKSWSHVDCTEGHDVYICHNCESDSD